jgi:membrane-associated phospholipid phosphatase
MNIQNTISLSAAILYIIPVLAYMITQNIIHVRAFVGLFATMGLGEAIKHFVIKKASPRPKGARDCNLWCNDGIQEGMPGMPSGHSAQVAFFSSYYYQQTKNEWIRAGLILYALLVMVSRYQKNCHSIPQIVTGALLGYIVMLCVNCSA